MTAQRERHAEGSERAPAQKVRSIEHKTILCEPPMEIKSKRHLQKTGTERKRDTVKISIDETQSKVYSAIRKAASLQMLTNEILEALSSKTYADWRALEAPGEDVIPWSEMPQEVRNVWHQHTQVFLGAIQFLGAKFFTDADLKKKLEVARAKAFQEAIQIAENGKGIPCTFDNCSCGGPDECRARKPMTPKQIADAIRHHADKNA